jgi:hypothetical protein
MASPLWIDGPLEGREFEVPDDTIEQGIYRHTPEAVYTFGLVEFLGSKYIVASVRTGILDFGTLTRAMLTPEARRAVQP